MTPDQLHIVEMLCATADWGFPPETAEAIRAVVKDAKRYAVVREYEWHSGTGRGIDVRIRGEFPDIDAAVDSLMKGAQGK